MVARRAVDTGQVFRVKAADVGNPTKADIILRTSKAAARMTVDVEEIWDGEIVLKGVVFERRATP
jgi:hypothetical protein